MPGMAGTRNRDLGGRSNRKLRGLVLGAILLGTQAARVRREPG